MATLPAYLVVSRKMAKRLEGSSAQYFEKWEQVAESLQDTLGAIKTVKVASGDLRPGTKVLYELGMDRTGKLAASSLRNAPPAE